MIFTLQGRGCMPGIAEGEALVCPESIQGWAGVSDVTGEIIEKGHSQEGQCIKDRILVLPCGKGSCGWSCHFHSAMMSGFTPAGWVVTKLDSRSGVGLVVVGKPGVGDFTDVNPCEVIKTGDWVKIDGNTGLVTVTRKDD